MSLLFSVIYQKLSHQENRNNKGESGKVSKSIFYEATERGVPSQGLLCRECCFKKVPWALYLPGQSLLKFPPLYFPIFQVHGKKYQCFSHTRCPVHWECWLGRSGGRGGSASAPASSLPLVIHFLGRLPSGPAEYPAGPSPCDILTPPPPPPCPPEPPAPPPTSMHAELAQAGFCPSVLHLECRTSSAWAVFPELSWVGFPQGPLLGRQFEVNPSFLPQIPEPEKPSLRQ